MQLPEFTFSKVNQEIKRFVASKWLAVELRLMNIRITGRNLLYADNGDLLLSQTRSLTTATIQ